MLDMAQIIDWIETYQSNVIWSVVVLLLYTVMTRFALPRLEKNIESSKLKSSSTIKGLFVIRVLSATISLALLLLVWGVDFSGLLVMSTSIVTLTGVALFANWSLLSNITAYFILLTNVAYRRGNYIRILDGDNYMEGYIADINLFSTRLVTQERETVLYPNNLILTRPTLINPKGHWQSMGKVTVTPPVQEELPAKES
ncbi:mechanosensitive ion channel family protein [Alteromonas aestuariivivens]|uniref:Small-conductance mechanosensitive channel n=1 Tax=Alteromonas aestuariivivens TaxID=1938339 RepID=A0A3D8M2Y0_9ALTE|nr:mechanosensitive ion channel domain-containing protein [Alteromonas aestuariivivens]RDV24073.1 mechanosensitive ion channel family protein [Alteromonas aestuariivivens]